jgi:hypothetical protein
MVTDLIIIRLKLISIGCLIIYLCYVIVFILTYPYLYPYPYTLKTNCKMIYEKEYLSQGFTKYLVIIELENTWKVTKTYFPEVYLSKTISECRYNPNNYNDIFIEHLDLYPNPYKNFLLKIIVLIAILFLSIYNEFYRRIL